MKEIKIKIYNFSELSDDVKDIVIERNRYTYVEDDMEFFNEYAIDQIRLKGFSGDVDLRHSLSYCQGDGLSFSCTDLDPDFINGIFKEILGDKKPKTIQAIQDNCSFELKNKGRYCYSSRSDLTYSLENNYGQNIIDLVAKVEEKLRDTYMNLCSELEDEGYKQLESSMSDEYISSILSDETDVYYLENGQLFNL